MNSVCQRSATRSHYAELEQLVTQAAPITISRVTVSTGPAATLLVTAGQNIDRLGHEAAFAALCGASPLPVCPRGAPTDTASTTAATATPTAPTTLPSRFCPSGHRQSNTSSQSVSIKRGPVQDAAMAALRTNDSYLQALYRRKRTALGPGRAVGAVKHSMICAC